MSIQPDHVSRPRNHLAPHITVIPRHQLLESKTAPTRGLAHAGFAEIPEGSPGKLDFEPLLLCAVGVLHPGEGAEMHEHDNIDNVLLLRRGTVRHRDSLGNEAVFRPGDACLLAAGESIEHAETVEGADDVHAVVIWIRPDRRGGPSHFYQHSEGQAAKRSGWSLLACGRPQLAGHALPLRRDAEILSADVGAGCTIEHHVNEGRRAYLVVLDGAVLVNTTPVETGERALIEGAGKLEFFSPSAAKLVLIDLRRG